MGRPCVVLLAAPGLGGENLRRVMEIVPPTELGRMARSGAFGILKDLPSETAPQDLATIATGIRNPSYGIAPKLDLDESIDVSCTGLFGNAPLWEICAEQGVESCCIAWPGLRESSSGRLLTVTDAIHIPLGSSHQTWPLLPHTVSQQGFEAPMMRLRVHPSEIPERDIDYLLHDSADLLLRSSIRNALAAAATVQAITLDIIARQTFGVISVYFDILDFGRREHERGLIESPIVVARTHQFFDLVVRNIQTTLSNNSVLIIVSPSTRSKAGKISAGATVISSSDIEESVQIDPRLEDIAPTVLYVVGCAIPKNWPGKSLIEAWKGLPPLRLVGTE